MGQSLTKADSKIRFEYFVNGSRDYEQIFLIRYGIMLFSTLGIIIRQISTETDH